MAGGGVETVLHNILDIKSVVWWKDLSFFTF